MLQPLLPGAQSGTDAKTEYDVLGCFAHHFGYLTAGEIENAKLLYLIGTSRLFDAPMHVVIKGPSAAGKSELRKRALQFFPAEEVITFTSMSKRAMLYEDRDYTHKILSMDEAVGAEDRSTQNYYLREMMSAGRIVHKIPIWCPFTKRYITQTIVKNGPVSFWVTTTRDRLHTENETRMLSMRVSDSPEQTRLVMDKYAETVTANKPFIKDEDMAAWHRFQRQLQRGECRVIIPYARDLAALIPPRQVRLRRDFAQLTTAIRACALLHREWRESDDDGIHADLKDYARVRPLMADIIMSEHPKITAELRQTLELVKSMPGCNSTTVADALGIDQSAAHRRLQTAIEKGFVENRQAKPHRPGQYYVTQSAEGVLIDVLPTVEALAEAIAS
jgi:DNA-binding MarR family transcriptional regulator